MKPSLGKPRTKLLSGQLQLAQIDERARKQAAAVLEVLAGLRSPQQAAEDLGISLPTYFNLETRALRGLTFACCAQPPGRQQSLAPQLRQAQARAQDLERQLGRYQALLRSAQRNVGLPQAAAPRASPQSRRKPKPPAVRALRALKAIRQAEAPALASPLPDPAPGAGAG